VSPEANAWFLAEIKYLADRSPSAVAGAIEKMRTTRQNLADYAKIGTLGLIPGTRRVVEG
jgi:plasmid stabilization system protein ParE